MNVSRPRVLAVTIAMILLSVLMLAACGPTPSPTLTPAASPLPTGTQRPTFTPTVLALATETAAPPVEATTAVPSGTAQTGGRTPEPTLTPPELTPTPAATRVAGPPPKLSGTLIFPIFDTTAQTYQLYRLDLASGKVAKFIGQASQPAVTWDGTRIAWRSWKPDQRGLLSRPIDGTDIWQMIPFTEAARPDWSPDNLRFVFPLTAGA